MILKRMLLLWKKQSISDEGIRETKVNKVTSEQSGVSHLAEHNTRPKERIARNADADAAIDAAPHAHALLREHQGYEAKRTREQKKKSFV